MRATFPQFVVKLKLSPQSGKTFNDNSTKRKPLSAQARHSPRRGKLFRRAGRQTLSRFNFAERKDKRYVSFNLPSGKAIFPDSDLKQTRYVTINYKYLQKSGYKPIKAAKRQAKTSETAVKPVSRIPTGTSETARKTL